MSETAWLIEETWSGYVHYVHRDFDCSEWAAECRRDDQRRSYGLVPLMRVHIVTKSIDDAMRFETKNAAELWLAFQPRWMSKPDGQYQVREHMWPTPAGRAALAPTPTEGEER